MWKSIKKCAETHNALTKLTFPLKKKTGNAVHVEHKQQVSSDQMLTHIMQLQNKVEIVPMFIW